MLLTRPPLSYPRRNNSARLACIRHAASVRPEPGSNSPIKCLTCSFQKTDENLMFSLFFQRSLFSFQRSMSFSLSLLFSAATLIIYHVLFHHASFFLILFLKSLLKNESCDILFVHPLSGGILIYHSLSMIVNYFIK